MPVLHEPIRLTSGPISLLLIAGRCLSSFNGEAPPAKEPQMCQLCQLRPGLAAVPQAWQKGAKALLRALHT